MQACSVVPRTPRWDRRTSGCGKPEGSAPASPISLGHLRPPRSPRSPSGSPANKPPDEINPIAKHVAVSGIRAHERVLAFGAFNISSPLASPFLGIPPTGIILIGIKLYVTEKKFTRKNLGVGPLSPHLRKSLSAVDFHAA